MADIYYSTDYDLDETSATLTFRFRLVDLPSENIHSKARRVKGRASAICRLFTYADKFINIRANKRAKADNVNE